MKSDHFNRYFFIILAGSALLYSGLNPQYRTGVLNDDAAYVIAAHDLLSSPPLQTFAQTRPDFPFPGLPFLLAPLAKAVDPHWTLLESVSVLATLLSIFLLGQWTRKWMSPGESLAVTGFFAFNPIVARYSGIVMPAPYLSVAVVASFLLLGDLLKRPTILKALALGLVVSWGSLLRPEGVLLLVSIAAGLAWFRKWKELLTFLAMPFIGWSLFAVEVIKTSRTLSTEYGNDVASLVTYWFHHVVEIVPFISRFLQVLLVRTVLAVQPHIELTRPFLGLLIALFCLVVMGVGFSSLWREQRVHRILLLSAVLFCGSYFAIHVFWHVAIPRYCVTLLPFMLIFLVRGVHARLPFLKKPHLWAGGLTLLLAFSYTYRNEYALYQSLIEPNPMNAPPWQSIAWLKQNTPPTAKVLSTVAPSITLYARRSSLNLMSASNGEDFLSLLAKAHLDYIVDRDVKALTPDVDPEENPNHAWDRIRMWVHLYPQRFQPVFASIREKVTIYHVTPEAGFVEAYEKYTLAIQELQAGREQEAWQTLHQALVAFPRLGSAVNAIGVVQMSRQNFKDAERFLLKTTEFMPDSSIAMLNLAVVSHLQGEEAQSILYLKRGLEVSTLSGNREEFIRRIQMAQARQEIALPTDFSFN